MSRNKDEIMGHAADNDGIEEYDNPLPDWWLGMFFFTILWGIGYSVEYHFITGRSQAAAFDAEVAAAAETWPQSDLPTEVGMDAASIAAGEEVYKTTCLACHGEQLEGKIGPSLVDAEWLYGDAPADVLATISDGVITKGMPAWGTVLGQEKVNDVTAYVISKHAAAN
jgi:cytochrome c oxidase cbb3-type subunit 3